MTILADRQSARGCKHRCAACGTAFYDMGRNLTACPKCETPYAEASIPTGDRGGRKRSFHRGPRPPASESQRPGQDGGEAEPNSDDGAVPLLDSPDNTDGERDEDEAAGGAAESTDETPDPADTDGR